MQLKSEHISGLIIKVKFFEREYYSLSDLDVADGTIDFDVEEPVESDYVIILNPWTDKIVLPISMEQIIELSLVNQKFLTTIGGLDDEEDLIYLIAAKKIYANTNLMIIENSNEDGTFTYNFYRNRFFIKNNQPTVSITK